jgi:hypothetical protein
MFVECKPARFVHRRSALERREVRAQGITGHMQMTSSDPQTHVPSRIDRKRIYRYLGAI